MDKTDYVATPWPTESLEGGFSVFGFGYNGFSQLFSGRNGDGETVLWKPTVPCLLNVHGAVSSVVSSWTTAFFLKENGVVSTMGWIPGTNHIGEKANLLLEHFITDLCCSWTQLAFLTKDGDCLVWVDYTKPNSRPLKVQNIKSKFKAVGCTESRCILVTESGKVGCATQEKDKEGIHEDGLLFKVLDIDLCMISVACGKEHAVLLSTSGVVYSLGGGSRGQLGCGLTVEEQSPKVVRALEGIKIQLVAAGGWHSAAVSDFGDLYMWGWNESGQLGLAANQSAVDDSACCSGQIQAVPVPVDFPDDLDILTASCGARHTAAVAGDGSVWTWGWGYHGQLGHGDRENRMIPKQVDAFSNVKQKSKTVSCGEWCTFVIVGK